MRTLLWGIGLFCAAVLITLLAQANTGYVIVIFSPHRIEFSLNVMFLSGLGLFSLFYAVIRAFNGVLALPAQAKIYRRKRLSQQALQAMRLALVAYFEGRYSQAEKYARQALQTERNKEWRSLEMLLAAHAAHGTKAYQHRDDYLQQLEQGSDSIQLARLLSSARFLADQYRREEALRQIEAALVLSPTSTAALRLELKLRQETEDPRRVLELVDLLQKSDPLPPAQRLKIRAHASASLVEQGMGAEEFTLWWNRQTEEEQAEPRLALAAAHHCFLVHDIDLALSILANALAVEWSSELIQRYGEYGQEESCSQRILAIQRAETWLLSHSEDHALLLTLGRLCRAQSLWGKAQSYLEASLSVQETAIAHAELGLLLETLDREEDAQGHYRMSLALALGTLKKD